MPRVAVLGGGISGLAAAHRLQELAQNGGAQVETILLEATETLGGCVRTVKQDGFVMELGGDSLLAEKPAIASLLQRLGLTDRLVATPSQFGRAMIVHRGTLRDIPEGFRLFAPRSIPALLRSRIFSLGGVARAAMEPFIRAQANGDETLASFVTRRFGAEVLERLAQPLIGGVYSGDPSRLSMESALPQFLTFEREYGSVLRGLAASPPAAPVRLMSLRNGLSELVNALAARVRDAIRTSAPVSSAERGSDGWRVRFESGEPLDCDAIVCALPAPSASLVLRAPRPSLADGLAAIRCNSIATLNFGYAAPAPHLPPSTGFVVPLVENRRITAATFSSNKYPGRTPTDAALVRGFAGGALQPELVALDDDTLAGYVKNELRELAGVRIDPSLKIVTRWKQALPEYETGHRARVARLREETVHVDGLALAGCAYDGVGIPDCIASGELAAETVFRYLSRA